MNSSNPMRRFPPPLLLAVVALCLSSVQPTEAAGTSGSALGRWFSYYSKKHAPAPAPTPAPQPDPEEEPEEAESGGEEPAEKKEKKKAEPVEEQKEEMAEAPEPEAVRVESTAEEPAEETFTPFVPPDRHCGGDGEEPCTEGTLCDGGMIPTDGVCRPPPPSPTHVCGRRQTPACTEGDPCIDGFVVHAGLCELPTQEEMDAQRLSGSLPRESGESGGGAAAGTGDGSTLVDQA